MIFVIILLGYYTHLSDACAPCQVGNGQGPGKGDLLSLGNDFYLLLFLTRYFCQLSLNLITGGPWGRLTGVLNSFLELEQKKYSLLLPGLAMQSVESTVCDNWGSGTNEEVWIRFKTTKSNSSCATDVLDGSGNDWERDSTQTWGYERCKHSDQNYLGCCANAGITWKERPLCEKEFRPSDDLEFRVEFLGHNNMIINHVEICHLRVTFGSKDQNGSSIWEWRRTDGPPGEGAWKKGCLTCKISVQISLRW